MRDEQLAQRVARAHGFQRTGRRIRDAVFALVPRGCAITKESEAAFIWPPSIAPSSWSVFRDPGRGEQRDPADVPIEELAALARRVLHGAADEEAALILMRDACGLAKLRDATRERCEAAIRKVSGTLI
jgi:hypothetical protein